MWTGAAARESGVGDCGRRRSHGGWAFMFACTNLLFRGPVAIGDNALYYVWRDECCLTADRSSGCVQQLQEPSGGFDFGQPARLATRLPGGGRADEGRPILDRTTYVSLISES